MLLAVVDANFLFPVVDVGAYGRQSDGGIFRILCFGADSRGTLDIFPVIRLPNSTEALPHVFVADEAFPLKESIMRPYSAKDLWSSHRKRVFNYRLTRARRIVENAAFQRPAGEFSEALLCATSRTREALLTLVSLYTISSESATVPLPLSADIICQSLRTVKTGLSLDWTMGCVGYKKCPETELMPTQ